MNPYELAQELLEQPLIDDVQVSKQRITVAHEHPMDEDRETVDANGHWMKDEAMEQFHEQARSVLEDTLWKHGYGEDNYGVEVHDTVGGRSHSVFADSRKESQIHFVK